MHDLRRLRAFHAVAERRSFSEAALALGYAQSVVSHHVAALEQEFGLTLVDRTRRPVGLTEAGERLNEHAAAVLGQVSTAEEELRALAGLLTGTVRVGAFLSACTSFVPQALARFEAAHPDVDVAARAARAGPGAAAPARGRARHRRRLGGPGRAQPERRGGLRAPVPGRTTRTGSSSRRATGWPAGARSTSPTSRATASSRLRPTSRRATGR